MNERRFYLTNAFKRDAKKHYLAFVSTTWADVVDCLATGKPMPEKYQDHALTGNFIGFRDCHLKPDLVLIYKINGDIVELHRLGTHADLF